MIIRQAKKQDLAAILAILAIYEPEERALSLEEAEVIYKRILLYPDYNIYVAVINNNVVATFALAIMDNLAHMGSKSGLIEDVAVLPEFQGQGIGKAMMEYAINICREKISFNFQKMQTIHRTE